VFVRCDACLQAGEKYYQLLTELKRMESVSRQIRITARVALSDVTRNFLRRTKEYNRVFLLMSVPKLQRGQAVTQMVDATQ
jgi:hypothetical protein